MSLQLPVLLLQFQRSMGGGLKVVLMWTDGDILRIPGDEIFCVTGRLRALAVGAQSKESIQIGGGSLSSII
jgi:hypothetical protein